MKKAAPELHMNHGVTKVMERAGGFYWKFKAASKEFGPFATLLDAITDMEADDDAGCGYGESPDDAEIGITMWMDPETGLPPEAAILHLEEY
ncbi:MAG: hypothetical protein LAN36_16180 [Acidobacteriia bacterium]|nr:hypothetical protein [Terriglobia bacterium]